MDINRRGFLTQATALASGVRLSAEWVGTTAGPTVLATTAPPLGHVSDAGDEGAPAPALPAGGPAGPPALAAPRARRGSLARRRAGLHACGWCWTGVSGGGRERRRGALGGRGAGGWERLVLAKKRSTGWPQPTTSRVVSGVMWLYSAGHTETRAIMHLKRC